MRCGECPIYGLREIVLDGKPWKLCPLDMPGKIKRGGYVRIRFDDSECDYSLAALMQAECWFRTLANGLSELIRRLEALREAEERAVQRV